jgi:hypothetical protein
MNTRGPDDVEGDGRMFFGSGHRIPKKVIGNSEAVLYSG